MKDDLLSPVDAECEAIRRLMTEEAVRRLSNFEAARVERHVDGCDACAEILEDPAGIQARDLRRLLPAPPTEAEWGRIKAGIWNEIGLDEAVTKGVAAPASRAGTTSGAPSRSAAGGPSVGFGSRLLRIVLPAAAGFAIAWLMFDQSSRRTPAPAEPEKVQSIAAEILELGDGQDFVILTGEDEDGVVILMTTSG